MAFSCLGEPAGVPGTHTSVSNTRNRSIYCIHIIYCFLCPGVDARASKRGCGQPDADRANGQRERAELEGTETSDEYLRHILGLNENYFTPG